MLGSEHDGERANAAKKASDMVRAAGMTWEQVLAQQPTVAAFKPTSGQNFGDIFREHEAAMRAAAREAAVKEASTAKQRARDLYEERIKQARAQARKPSVYDWPFKR